MEVYDKVNNLAKAIKESKEYKEYKEIKQELFVDPKLKEQVEVLNGAIEKVCNWED